MKRKLIIIALALGTVGFNVNAYAGMWDSTKEMVNKAIPWKDKHLKDVDFEHIYPKALYKKSYFGSAVVVTTVVAAGAFSYFTAGAGAPAAAAGVSSVASWIGGGGAGSYMAGLSTLGGYFGGNAMLGAAILNGASIGTIGGAAEFASLSVVAKAGVAMTMTATTMDGVALFVNPDTKKLEYRVRVTVPKNLGGKSTRQVVDRVYAAEEDIKRAFEEGDELKQQAMADLRLKYFKQAKKLLKEQLGKGDNQEDLIVLGIMAWNQGAYELFDKAMLKIKFTTLDNTGFLNYLVALNDLSQGKQTRALDHLDTAIDENPYAIEPVILYINIIGNDNFFKEEMKIASLIKSAEKNFDADKYETGYSMSSLYYRVAAFYFSKGRYVKAGNFYQKALDKLGLIQKYIVSSQLKHIVQLGLANSFYAQSKLESAEAAYQEILADIDADNSTEREWIWSQYLGSQH